MSEELLQRNLVKNPEKIGNWDFYNIGSTTVKSLKEYGIIRNVDYGEENNKKVDAIIVQKKNVIAIIEYKKPAQFRSEMQKEKAIKQEIKTAKKLGSKIIIATDTKDTIWVNVLTGERIKDEYGNEIKTAFDPKDENIEELIKKINYSINEKNNNLRPKQLVNPTDLAKQIWQDIWSVSGATPENCLYTFVELFIFKYLSDLDVLKGVHSFNHLVDSFRHNTDEEILEIYATSVRPKIKELFPPSTIDKTTIINGTIFVSKDQKAVMGYSTVFKKVLQKFKDYGKLENIDYDFKSKLFESFLKESISKKNWGQFFTPLVVVRAIVEMSKDDIKIGAKICDPACGVGKFLLEPIVTKLDYFYDINNNSIKPKITIRGFDKGFDKDEQKTIILAKANMLIYFSDLIKEHPGITKDFAKLFNECFVLKTNSILGTLSDPVEEEYDLILTNPPYVTSGSSNLKEEIRKGKGEQEENGLANYYKINALGVEGLFMEWIIRALKPAGKAYVVIPDGILNRQNDKHLRKFILDECVIDGIISLPLNTFFTTNKKTYILCITKKSQKTDIQKEPVFTYLVSEIGESRDVYRFDIDQNDLKEAVTLFSFFKGNKESFAKINSDKRCKIQPIDKFNPEVNWSIDRWWSKEEKIEMGIIEENKSITISEFGDYIGEVADTLVEFKGLLKEIDEEKKNDLSELTKTVSLNDTDLFDLFIGERILKKDIRKTNGEIPIFSANVSEPFGYHHKSNIDDFSNNFILWGIDGGFHFNYIKKGNSFVTTDHCGSIRIKTDEILPEYLIYQLNLVKHEYGFDRSLRASLKNMKTIKIQLPIKTNGEFDIDKQTSIVDKFLLISELNDKVSAYKQKINSLTISIEKDFEFELRQIDTIFNVEKGLSKYTKKYGNSNKGDYPVFSASNRHPLTYINSYDFCGEYLTWATNGFAGFIKILNGEFSINGDRGILMPLYENIDIYYVKYVLEPILREIAKGRKGDKGEDEFTKVYPPMVKEIKIPFPINKQGKIDRDLQKYIADQYKKIDDIKAAMNLELNRIIETEIQF